MRKLGLNPRRLGELILEDEGLAGEAKPAPAVEAVDPKLSALEQKLAALEAERQKEREEYQTRAQRQQHEAMVSAIHEQIAKDDRFEAVQRFADVVVPVHGVAAKPAEHVMNMILAVHAQGATLTHPDGREEYFPPGTDLRKSKRGLDNVVKIVDDSIMELARRATSIRALQPKTEAAPVRETASVGREVEAPVAAKPKRTITNSNAVVATSGSTKRVPSKQESIAAMYAVMNAPKR